MGADDDFLAVEDDAVREFREAVARSVPRELEVTPVPDGFDVTYREELTQRGISMRIDSTFRAVVRCDPLGRTFTMEDRGITRHESLAGLRMTVSGFKGRQHARRTVTMVGKRDDDTYGEVGSQTQDTRVIHAAVREPAKALGWTEEQPASAKIGKVVAISTGVAMVISGVVVGVLFLAGVLP